MSGQTMLASVKSVAVTGRGINADDNPSEAQVPSRRSVQSVYNAHWHAVAGLAERRADRIELMVQRKDRSHSRANSKPHDSTEA